MFAFPLHFFLAFNMQSSFDEACILCQQERWKHRDKGRHFSLKGGAVLVGSGLVSLSIGAAFFICLPLSVPFLFVGATMVGVGANNMARKSGYLKKRQNHAYDQQGFQKAYRPRHHQHIYTPDAQQRVKFPSKTDEDWSNLTYEKIAATDSTTRSTNK